jgi:hypothetical protein
MLIVGRLKKYSTNKYSLIAIQRKLLHSNHKSCAEFVYLWTPKFVSAQISKLEISLINMLNLKNHFSKSTEGVSNFLITMPCIHETFLSQNFRG